MEATEAGLVEVSDLYARQNVEGQRVTDAGACPMSLSRCFASALSYSSCHSRHHACTTPLLRTIAVNLSVSIVRAVGCAHRRHGDCRMCSAFYDGVVKSIPTDNHDQRTSVKVSMARKAIQRWVCIRRVGMWTPRCRSQARGQARIDRTC